MMGFDVPILFIIFNRPETTEKVFERIREMKPTRLFLAADGPRAHKPGEHEKCEQARNIVLKGVDWDCKLETKLEGNNLGCGRAESEAMIWFFRSIGEGIVLEDDTFPDLSFFRFCKELLSKYRNDESVWMIGGNNFQNGRIRSDGSYYFSGNTHSWGYASWLRAWESYDLHLRDMSDSDFDQIVRKRFARKDEIEFWTNVYRRLRRGEFDTWDYQFLFNMWRHGGKCIIPAKNLVSNLGFGAGATHTTDENNPLANLDINDIGNIVHPGSMKISQQADRYVFENFYQVRHSLLKRIRNRISRIFPLS